MPAKLTTQEFINKAKLKHGDKFGYDKVNYINADTKVIITCRVHGDFLQKPGNHLFGACCRQCRVERTGKANSMSQEEFITKSQEAHGQKYDYSKVTYTGCFNPVEIVCPKHGSFYQKPSIHLTNHGCAKCGKERVSNLTRKTTGEFIKEAIRVHGEKYDYSLVEYKGSHKTVKIVCPVHGIFSQKPYSHLAQQGCTKCWLEHWANRLKIDTGIFIERAVKKHGNRYDYSLIEYVESKVSVKILCPIHGMFEQTPNSHLSGRGCESCSLSSGEREIALALEKFGISFTAQKRFDDCRDKNKLPFDFYFEVDSSRFLVEYDGIHHHENIPFFHKKRTLSKIQSQDAIKTQFALDNGFTLIRIPYTEFDNIETIIKQAINS